MEILKRKEIQKKSNSAKAIILSDFAIFVTVCWFFVAFLLRPFFAVHWFAPGDFSYSAAMYYHGIMVPVLILLYLLTKKILPLRVVNKRLYAVSAILSVLLIGFGSIFNTSKGISVATVVQIIGMVMTDCLGIALVAAMIIFALGEKRNAKDIGMAFWLLFSSIIAILIAAPLGHLAGGCVDIGAKSVPGLHALLKAADIKSADFQNGLATSHSHLIVAALLCGLAALTALYFQYQSRVEWRKRTSLLGLWVTLISLSVATGIYVISAIVGWEPPVLFASGPSGIPLDDVILTALEIGFLILMVGISGSLESAYTKPFSPIKADIRISIFCNWIFGFLGAVFPGIYIELNEGFYGAGVFPAPGALSDNIFIRAHLLYPFLLLPIIFSVTLAVGCKYNHTRVLWPWPRLFVWTSVFGMALGLAGEILWFVTRENNVFLTAMFVMGIAIFTGIISLWPNADIKESYHKV